MQDSLLLRRFADHGSQAAFAELVGRYLRLVHSTCLREVGDRQMAEDVTQGVFLILAQKAPSLGRHVPLAGWLFRTAVFVSKTAVRQEQRRRRWERAAASETAGGDAWPDTERRQQEVALNEALAALGPGEREAVLLRFFDEASFREIGETLGLSEDTAQKRVSRALEKMRTHLARHGEILSVAALLGVLSAEAARTVPVGCASPLLQIIPGLKIALETSSLAGSRSYQIAQGVLRTMKVKTAITTATVGALAVASVTMLMAGAGNGNGSIVGTWTGQVPPVAIKQAGGTGQVPAEKLTMRFAPDGTATLNMSVEDPRTHQALRSAVFYKYTMTRNVLSISVVQQQIGGKVTPAKPKDLRMQKVTTTFSNGGKTLTLYDITRQPLVLTRQ